MLGQVARIGGIGGLLDLTALAGVQSVDVKFVERYLAGLLPSTVIKLML